MLLNVFANEIAFARVRKHDKLATGTTVIQVGEHLILWFDAGGTHLRMEFIDERQQGRGDLFFKVTRA